MDLRLVLATAAVLTTFSTALAQGPPPIVWLGGGHAGGINRLVATTDGNIWTAGNDRTIKQWRSADISLQRTVQTDYVRAAASISRDGQRCAAVGSVALGI